MMKKTILGVLMAAAVFTGISFCAPLSASAAGWGGHCRIGVSGGAYQGTTRNYHGLHHRLAVMGNGAAAGAGTDAGAAPTLSNAVVNTPAAVSNAVTVSNAGYHHGYSHTWYGCGRYYVDANGDGICDNHGAGGYCQSGYGCGQYYVDANGDGICDNCGVYPGNCLAANSGSQNNSGTSNNGAVNNSYVPVSRPGGHHSEGRGHH